MAVEKGITGSEEEEKKDSKDQSLALASFAKRLERPRLATSPGIGVVTAVGASVLPTGPVEKGAGSGAAAGVSIVHHAEELAASRTHLTHDESEQLAYAAE